MRELKGRVAVVTGAGNGIGAGIARVLAREGMRLALADVDVDAMRRVGRELRAAGAEILEAETDVADSQQLEALAERVFAQLGGAHLLCNNAGVCQGGPIWEMTPQDWQWLMSVNLGGVVNGCRAFVPRLLDQGEPAHIVNTSSIGGFVTGGELGMYSTSKYAVIAYTEALAQELEPRGIGVSALCPGWTRTDLPNSQRHRPAELGRAQARMEVIEPGMAAGMDPEQVGRYLLRGVRERALYIFTHADLKPVVELRFRTVLEALDRACEPPPDGRP